MSLSSILLDYYVEKLWIIEYHYDSEWALSIYWLGRYGVVEVQWLSYIGIGFVV